jgi:hypothetical protein
VIQVSVECALLFDFGNNFTQGHVKHGKQCGYQIEIMMTHHILKQHSFWRKLDNIVVITANVTLAFSMYVLHSNPNKRLLEGGVICGKCHKDL